ncbi:hypothetical protein [Paludisphaera mucosa]|uniref:Uncharacterized protein n=1 Tax=Paludisphaera mucosa TaxID=3030827 RepID=A0ABT6FKN5_9BACT|nr:hypothetical protein [Paludisphaera mucosa]MDG3008137.1 hypothetical protein [Paludisphaera mucosa]
MIAQILSTTRREALPASRSAGDEPSRGAEVGVRCARVALAFALLPALATMLLVGGVGLIAVGLATTLARSVDAATAYREGS